jgi:thiol:disulfide interchange protein DsbD
MDRQPTSTGLPPKRRRRDARAGSALAAALVAAVALSAFGQSNPLPADEAFRFTARLLGPHTVEARFLIADGYYLYRDRVHFAVEPASAGLAVPPLPEGKVREDQFFGRVETYRGNVVVNLTLSGAKPGQQVVIEAQSQGCADIGLCYPATVQRVTLALPEASMVPQTSREGGKKPWFN